MSYDPLPPDICHAALQFSDALISLTDAEGSLLYLNPTGHALLELEPGTAYNKSWSVFLHENDRPRILEAYQHVTDTGQEALDLETRVVGTLGRESRLRLRLCTLRDAEDSQTRVLCIGRDISEQRRLEDLLHQSQKLETIGMLAGGIAHDLNNMLAAILGYAELMLEDRSEDAPDHRALTYVRASTERAAALVKQLLIFSRRSTAELKPVRIGTVVAETLQMLQRTLPKTIRISVYSDEPHDRVMADAGRLQQALMNLCVNARDAMPAGGELRIEVERVTLDTSPEGDRGRLRPGDYVRLRIQDTGAGMSPETLERIWEPFYTTKPTGEGTGLGLSVVQGILRSHRGHIQVESQPGRGTTFYLYLPAASDTDPEAAQALAEPPGGNETILVVDDEPVLLELLNDILFGKGYRVLAAASGSDALEYIEMAGDQIDLVISDNMMPGMTGRELALEIRRRQPEMKILVCSGFSPTRRSEIADLDYVSSYVQKPYQRRDLLTRVREVLDSRKDDAKGNP